MGRNTGRLYSKPASGKKLSRRNRKRNDSNSFRSKPYTALEPRQVLAALFPTYINGQFTLGNGPNASLPYDLNQTFDLSSRPGANKTIYLDFNGHHSVNNDWDHDIQFNAFDRDGNPNNFSNAELAEIQQQFQNVAEDFLPFDVNVTTRNPGVERLRRTGANDQQWGVRAVNTQPKDGFGNFGGVAYLNSFSDNIDNPVFVINKGANTGAMTNSHEVGHALGLFHDGLGNNQYHPGSGSGETSWGPLLGAPFGTNVTQWSNGDYSGSTTSQNDLAVITGSSNGFGFRADDNGNTRQTASTLNQNGSDVFEWGIIERRNDVDFFRFQTSGSLSIGINPFEGRPNLDIRARLYNSSGTLIATSSPGNALGASFNMNVAPGEYFISVDGVGRSGSYSDYGSLGMFTIDGVIENTTTTTVPAETGTLSVSHRWQTVNLDRNYQNPVVIAGPASINGGSPTLTRVRNVTSSSFEIQIDEWEYLDGRHSSERVDYMVIEAGQHTLSDGTVIMAGNATRNHQWATVNFANAFSGGAAPVVLTQAVTVNDPVAIVPRVRNVSTSGFSVKLQEEQAANRVHGNETLSWIAIERSTGTHNGSLFEVARTGNVVTHNNRNISFTSDFSSTPVFLAAFQTTDGGDAAGMRHRTLNANGATVFVQEERSADIEIVHTTEIAGYFAIEPGVFGSTAANAESGSSAMLARSAFSYRDSLIGNLSQYQGQYPDYSSALRAVASRGDETRSLENNARDLSNVVKIDDVRRSGVRQDTEARSEIETTGNSLDLAGAINQDSRETETRSRLADKPEVTQIDDVFASFEKLGTL